MVRVKLTDGRTIRMIWHYNMNAVDPIYGKPSIQTSCHLTDDTEEGNIIPLGAGTTIKSKKDNHCKETARAKSLERACRNAGFDPYTTDQVLIAYKHRPRPKNVEVFDVLTPEQAQEELDKIFADTCFECGGLMKDDTQLIDLKIEGKKAFDKIQINVRRCSVCGHSHT